MGIKNPFLKESIMDKAFEMVSGFLGRVCDIGVKLIAVGVVLQILLEPQCHS